MADTKQMTKTERQTLIRLVKQRFNLLETGLAARRNVLRRTIEDEIRAEREDDVKRFQQRFTDEVIAPLRDLLAEGDEIIEDARKAGLDRTGYSSYGRLRSILETEAGGVGFHPAELQREVERRMVERIGDKPMSTYALELKESQLIEQLLVGDLTSDDAKAFLDSVPTLEGLIPLPPGTNGSVGELEA